MLAAGSGSGLKDFPYTIGEHHTSAWGSWAHHRGTFKDDGSPVSIFSLSGSSPQDRHLIAGRNGVERLRTVRHPNILSFFHTTEAEIPDGPAVEHTIYIATEPVTPLIEKIKELSLGSTQRDEYFARGLRQISEAVSFLNNDRELVHWNVCLASVVVTETLDWKLHAFDVLSEFDANSEDVCSPMLQFESLVGNQYKPAELMNSDWVAIRNSPRSAIDSWGFACLIYELFSGGKLMRTEDLCNISSIPESLLPDYQKLLSSTPSHRISPSELIDKSEFFQNKVIETMQFMKEVKHEKVGDLDSSVSSLHRLAGNPKRKPISDEAPTEGSTATCPSMDFYSRNYGLYPLSEFQRVSSKRRKYTDLSGLSSEDVGRSVLVRGWLQAVKALGKRLIFITLRDGVSTLQCVLSGDHSGGCTDMAVFVKKVPKESFVDIHGVIKLSPKTNEIELQIEKLYVITEAAPLPFLLEDATRAEGDCDKVGNVLPHVELAVRLDHRTFDLRTDVSQSIFSIRSAVEEAFSLAMRSSGFTSIQTPKITPGIGEGGSAVFQLKYINGEEASLAQSPQLYKQMAVSGGMKRVFEIGPVFRAENSDTPRHLCEYTGLHAEMEIMNDYFEVVELVDRTFVRIFDHFVKHCSSMLMSVRKQYPSSELKYLRETCKLKYTEGIKMLKDSGFPIDEFEDLTRAAERKLGELVLQKYKTDFFILYDYPLSLRPFYTMPSIDDRYSNSFDAFLRGEEILTGGQRIHIKDLLRQRVLACELDVDGASLKSFLESFEFAAPPRGGFGAGLERVVMRLLDLPNIRLASLFPRDPVHLKP